MSKKQNYFTSFVVYSLAAVLLLVGNPYLIATYLLLLLVARLYGEEILWWLEKRINE